MKVIGFELALCFKSRHKIFHKESAYADSIPPQKSIPRSIGTGRQSSFEDYVKREVAPLCMLA